MSGIAVTLGAAPAAGAMVAIWSRDGSPPVVSVDGRPAPVIAIHAVDGARRTVVRWRGRTFIHYGTARQIAATRYAAAMTFAMAGLSGEIAQATTDYALYGTSVVDLKCDAVHHSPAPGPV